MPIDLPKFTPKDLPSNPEQFLPLGDLPRLEALPEFIPTDSKLVIGMIGWSIEPIAKGDQHHCHFPIGDIDSRFIGGRTWERVRVTALDDIRAYSEVMIVDDKRNVIEKSLMTIIQESVIINETRNIRNNKTLTSKAYETSGFNKITGLVYADQDITVYIDQSVDGENWDETTTVVDEATSGAFSVEIVAPYLRIRTSNQSGTDTQTCRRFVQFSAGF